MDGWMNYQICTLHLLDRCYVVQWMVVENWIRQAVQGLMRLRRAMGAAVMMIDTSLTLGWMDGWMNYHLLLLLLLLRWYNGRLCDHAYTWVVSHLLSSMSWTLAFKFLGFSGCVQFDFGIRPGEFDHSCLCAPARLVAWLSLRCILMQKIWRPHVKESTLHLLDRYYVDSEHTAAATGYLVQWMVVYQRAKNKNTQWMRWRRLGARR